MNVQKLLHFFRYLIISAVATGRTKLLKEWLKEWKFECIGLKIKSRSTPIEESNWKPTRPD